MSNESLDQFLPNLPPELVAAARALAQQQSVEFRQAHDASCGIPIRDEMEALRFLALMGLYPALEETERKLNQSQDALSRWELMKWDLLEGPGRAVRPSDYCREFSPEDVAFFRSAEFRDLNAADQCERIADRLVEAMGVDEDLLFSDVGGEAVEMMVNRFKGLHCELIRLRAILLRAIRKQWPGTTHADWDALGSQPHA